MTALDQLARALGAFEFARTTELESVQLAFHDVSAELIEAAAATGNAERRTFQSQGRDVESVTIYRGKAVLNFYRTVAP